MALSKIRNDSLADTAVHGRRNLIINGAMQVSQRGTSFTTVDADYTLDRFRVDEYTDGALDVSQSTDAPDGFSNSLKLDITTADTTISSTYHVIVSQRLEAQNLQHLQYGTSSAKTMTLSFWVKSNKTGTYVLEVDHGDATNYLSVTYTIDTADTWEKKTINIAANTANAINNDNGEGLRLNWWLTAGSNFNSGTHNNNTWHTTGANRAAGLNVNIIDSTSNDWYLTGVQLEVGDTATPFEHRSFGEELTLCQRYFCKSYAMDKYAGATDDNDNQCTLARINSTVTNRTVENAKFPVRMRVKPTVTVYSLNGTSGSVSDTGTNSGTHTRDEPVGINKYGETGIAWFSSVGSFTAGDGAGFHFTADAEL